LKKKVFDLFVLIMLLSCVFLVLELELFPSYLNRNDITDIVQGTEDMHIKNTVVFVYLGSRLLDSLVESMVIVAGAFSVAYIWRECD